MELGYRQDERAAGAHRVGKGIWCDRQLAEAVLDGDFPDAGDGDDAGGRRDAFARGALESAIAGQPPERDLCVE